MMVMTVLLMMRMMKIEDHLNRKASQNYSKQVSCFATMGDGDGVTLTSIGRRPKSILSR